MFVTNVYWIERGALASFGSNTYVSGRQAARLVDKILRGAPPAQIPVEVNCEDPVHHQSEDGSRTRADDCAGRPASGRPAHAIAD